MRAKKPFRLSLRRRARSRAAGLGGLSEDDRQRLDALTTGIVNTLLHEPTVRVRAAAEGGDTRRHLASFRHLFALATEAHLP